MKIRFNLVVYCKVFLHQTSAHYAQMMFVFTCQLDFLCFFLCFFFLESKSIRQLNIALALSYRKIGAFMHCQWCPWHCRMDNTGFGTFCSSRKHCSLPDKCYPLGSDLSGRWHCLSYEQLKNRAFCLFLSVILPWDAHKMSTGQTGMPEYISQEMSIYPGKRCFPPLQGACREIN